MSNLIRIQYYQNAIEANRDKQILEESGVNSYIANEQTIQSDWLLSQAIGGIQLQVFEEDVERAKSILSEFRNEEKPELEVEHTIDNPDFDFKCPKCGSNHLYQSEEPDGVFGISWLFLGIPLKFNIGKYICYFCENEFEKPKQ